MNKAYSSQLLQLFIFTTIKKIHTDSGSLQTKAIVVNIVSNVIFLKLNYIQIKTLSKQVFVMEIWDFVKCFTIAYLLFFALYLLIKNKDNKMNVFLASFLLVETISILNTFLWRFFSYTHTHMPFLFYIDDSIFYMRGALLYLYIRSYTNDNFKLKRIHLLHLLPFAIVSVLFAMVFHRFNNANKTILLETGIFQPLTMFVIQMVLHLVIVFYLIATFREIYKFKTRLKNAYADIKKIWLNWTVFLVIGFFLFMFMDILYILFDFSFKAFPYFIVNSMNIMILALSVLIMFKGLIKPNIFDMVSEQEPTKYAGSNLKENDRSVIKNKLDNLLLKEKKYLNPDININDMAKEIGVLPKHLSQVINEDYKQNFFDLINSFRIEDAKELLANYSSTSKNVLEILYMTGFNSKTSFNMAFKKYTGHTPTSYRSQFSKSKKEK